MHPMMHNRRYPIGFLVETTSTHLLYYTTDQVRSKGKSTLIEGHVGGTCGAGIQRNAGVG
jgi:hypothetical protein